MYAVEDTIVGVASAAGPATRGIVRLSGPDVLACVARACRTASHQPLEFDLSAARVSPACLLLPLPTGAIPGDLYVWPDQRSYTRQPSAEFHSVGARGILEACVRQLCRCGARLAEPGEFTLRAFLAGRLDLTQAEAVLGVIDAQDRDQLAVALRQLAGGLAAPLTAVREQLIDLLAHLEAGLDFVEEDIEFISSADLVQQLQHAQQQIDSVMAQLAARGGGGGLPKVVLVGRVNAGKSSLFNAITGVAAAIVSQTEGTTRDYLSHRVDLGDGMLVELIDTAGLQSVAPDDRVGHSSQQAAAVQSQQAALRLVCIDAATPAADRGQNRETGADQLVVITKADLAGDVGPLRNAVATSARSGMGIADLKTAIRVRLAELLAGSSLVVPSTLLRCHESLTAARLSLRETVRLAAAEAGEELVAHELRVALDGLGKVLGAVYTEDILDRVFSRFCIGK